MKTILICVESDRQANTDSKYIQNTINYFYEIPNNISIKYVNFGSKTKAIKSNKDIVFAQKLTKGNAIIIYCLDTDNYDSNMDDVELNNRITSYCEKNGYELVWFCKTVEEVFLHKKVDKKQKIAEAKKIGRANNIGIATMKSLSSDGMSHYKSNILLILDKYLKRK